MTATLRLIPLSPEECRARLERKGEARKPSSHEMASPPEASDHPRGPLTLKLCEPKDDVVEVHDDGDDGDGTPAGRAECVTHASRYRDGSLAAILPLGRNQKTGIKAPMVSRALCDVSLTRSRSVGGREVCVVDLAGSPSLGPAGRGKSPFAASGGSRSSSGGQTDGQLPSLDGSDDADAVAAAFMGMRKPAGKHMVHLDGVLVTKPLGREFALPNGSIISLFGPTGFAYEVIISQKGDKEIVMDDAKDDGCGVDHASPEKGKWDPSVDAKVASVADERERPRRELRRRARDLMIGEFTCAMCMDILVRSTFAYPCMHPFCDECARAISDAVAPLAAPSSDAALSRASRGKCPTCRGAVAEWSAARSYDTIVWSAALQGCFGRDDAEYYLERREERGEDKPTALERECILNGAGGGADEGDRCLSPHQSPVPREVRLVEPVPSLIPAAASSCSSNKAIDNGLAARARPPNMNNNCLSDLARPPNTNNNHLDARRRPRNTNISSLDAWLLAPNTNSNNLVAPAQPQNMSSNSLVASAQPPNTSSNSLVARGRPPNMSSSSLVARKRPPNTNSNGLVTRKRPPNNGKSIDDVICID